MEKQHIHVPESTPAERVDRFLAKALEHVSRSQVQRLIEDHQVLLNDRAVGRVSEKIKGGDRLIVYLPDPIPSRVEAENLPLEILYQDEHLMAVNKPAGMAVHPAGGCPHGTLVNALLYHVHDLSGIGGERRPGIVHRLDRVTSGIMLVAKHDEAHRLLSRQFKMRAMHKVYWAIVHGRLVREEGEIDQPIGRHPTDRKRMTIRVDGRPALTRYRVRRTGLGGMWLEVYPFTGRTHQIRVHLKHLGCPVVGDSMYGSKKYRLRGQLETGFATYPGIGLHAQSLSFPHPMTGETMTLEAPAPEVIQHVLDQMR